MEKPMQSVWIWVERMTTVLLAGLAIMVAVKMWWPALASPRREPLMKMSAHLDPTVLTHRLGVGEVKVVEFADFQCPYCEQFYERTFPTLKNEWIDTGKVQFIAVDYPIPSHAFALPASHTAQCAGNRYWDAYQLLFPSLKAGTFSPEQTAKAIGLDQNEMAHCVAQQPSTNTNRELGLQLQVTGTPTFFVGSAAADGGVDVRVKLVGAVPIELIAKAIKGV